MKHLIKVMRKHDVTNKKTTTKTKTKTNTGKKTKTFMKKVFLYLKV